MRAFAVFAGIIALTTAQDLDFSMNTDGNFTILFNNKTWLQSSVYMVGTASTADRSLVAQGGAVVTDGTDAFGAYQATTWSWAKAGSGDTVMKTSIRTYTSDAGMIVFEQSFPTALQLGMKDQYVPKQAPQESFDKCRIVAKGRDFALTSSAQGYNAYVPTPSGAFTEHDKAYCDDGHQWTYTSNTANLSDCEAKCISMDCACLDYKAGGSSPSGDSLSAQTIFPSFARNSGPSDDLDSFSYHGVFPSMTVGTVSDYDDSHMGGSPIVIYDSKNATLPMVVFSPLNNAMAHHMAGSKTFIGAGIKSTVTEIPAGWSQLFVLSAGYGINDGMMAWGDRMLKYTGKPRADMYRDQTHSTIGFWTDNGGYYHYSIGTGEGANYGEVLPKVKAYHDSIGVPFGHWQFDSWFYFKDGPVNGGGGGGAVTNWSAMPSVFPQGMVGIQNQIKLPTVMHNRQWSDKSDYIKNEPFKWYEDKYAIPEDPDAFFKWFFTQQEGWGLSMYEQDWMCTEYDGVEHLQTNISLGDMWLKGMADGAASSNRTVQYCMPYANEVLSAAAYPAVSNARATGDYFHGPHQWAVGGTSLFYWAIGILPFKDGFYSSNNKQVGGQTVGPETNPDRETLMATLSCAMVGPMDGIFLLNKSRTMTTCRSDGMVLKPDRPVSTTDWCFANNQGAECYVYTTYSNIGGSYKVTYLYQNDATPITSFMVGASGSKYVVYNWYDGSIVPLAENVTIAAGYEDHVYAVVAPVLSNGMAFIGEVDKYVTAAKIRVTSLTSDASSMTVSLDGVVGEVSKFCAAKGTTLVCKTVTFSSGTESLVFN